MTGKRAPTIALAALLLFVALQQPVGALPGPDPSTASPVFAIIIGLTTKGGDNELLDRTDFARADNWDFGDREAYRCAYVEYIVGGEVQFKFQWERLPVSQDGQEYVAINDRYGMETEGGQSVDVCGQAPGAGGLAFDGSPFVDGGATLTVFKDTLPYVTYSLPAVDPSNADAFWSAGNDPGEAYLWYEEPGTDPYPVVRFSIIPVASGVALTPDPPLPTPTPTPSPQPPGSHDSAVTMRLRGSLEAIGYVRVVDGTLACLNGRSVVVERRAAGRWVSVGRDLTKPSGSYRVRLQDQAGTYRARVPGMTLATGDLCGSATSTLRVRPRH